MSQSKHTIKNLFTSSSLRIASAAVIFVSTLATTGATEASMRASRPKPGVNWYVAEDAI